MAIMTKTDVAELLSITDSAKIAMIDLLLPIVEDELLTYLNNNFTDSEGTITYPEGLKLPLVNMIAYRLNKPKDGIQSESIDGYSVSFAQDSMGGYPSSIMKSLTKYRKVKR